ncbi:MAG: hypothetical protein CL778_01185 [Chloroflexi bacterium]|nr:hypothetical protein [Chloroflexota bacterium]|tara:strand:+ start:30874 stop:31506 length:633 start_codon:yes stop_codon:yes gene_type:complete
MYKRKLFLFSSSNRRLELFQKAGIEFIQKDHLINERSIDLKKFKPISYPKMLAIEKLKSQKGNNQDLLIAVDTCVIYKDAIINKPSNIEEAKMNLQLLKSKFHMVVTSIVLKNNNQIICKSRISKVKLREFSQEEMNKYIQSKIPFDRAGGYGIQDEDFSPVESYKGCYLNIVGLPLCTLESILSKFDYSINILDCNIRCKQYKKSEDLI